MNMSKPTAVENLSTTPIRTIELSKKVDLINLIPDLPADQVFSWVRNNQGIVSWGINTKENFSGTERFSRAHKWWKEFVDNCSIRDEVLTSSSGAIAFVSFSYLAESSSVVVVPEVVVGQNSDKTWLTVIGDIDIEKIQAAIYAPKEVAKAPVNLTWTKGSISIDEWQKGVEKAVTRINNKELDKVVLARDLNAQADEVIDPRYVLTNLSDSYPECWSFSVDGLIGAIASDGRIHTSFQQTVAATGRLSSTEPNLQNIPIRTDEGRLIRDCFIAQKPYENLLTADYSQIEMRIMAHLSNDKGLIEAFELGEDLHSTVASQVFGVKATEVDAEMRRTIKAMSYGLAYGLSSFGLAQQLDIDPNAASELMSKYFERFGGIRDYLKTVVIAAREKGYTETVLGRRRYLPDLNHENRQRREIAERAALNAPIQGSAADIIKIAMLNVSKEINQNKLKSRLLLQVHDELILEVAQGEKEKLEEIVMRQMANAYQLRVPLDVNIGFGLSWDLAAH